LEKITPQIFSGKICTNFQKMPIEKIAEFLHKNSIPVEKFSHEKFETCAAAADFHRAKKVPAAKNLFFRDKKGRKFFLIICAATREISKEKVAEIFGQKKVAFATTENLMENLQTFPGAVSPFGLIFDAEKKVQIAAEKKFFENDFFNFHPNENAQSWRISRADFLRFLEILEREVFWF